LISTQIGSIRIQNKFFGSPEALGPKFHFQPTFFSSPPYRAGSVVFGHWPNSQPCRGPTTFFLLPTEAGKAAATSLRTGMKCRSTPSSSPPDPMPPLHSRAETEKLECFTHRRHLPHRSAFSLAAPLFSAPIKGAFGLATHRCTHSHSQLPLLYAEALPQLA
jgi:hypothetical protein